jgi:hypothetical protein
MVRQQGVNMRNRKLMAAFICLVLVLICIIPGCSSDESSTSYFPVAGGKSGMEALATGVLIIDDDYLRLSPSYSDDTYLIIWPRGYSLDTEGDEIRILDEDGNVVAMVGDNISAAGGEVDIGIVKKYIGESLPGDCNGPFWLASEVKLI